MTASLGLSPSERLKATVGGGHSILVGRAAEMAELEDAYGRLGQRGGQCMAVTLVGPGGLGKTRLVRDFLLKLRTHPTPPRVYRGSAREGGPAYEVLARALRARFGIVEGMDPEAAKAQVRAQVSQVLEDRKVGDVVYFLGQLIELSFFDSPLIKAVEGDPQQLPWLRRAVIKRFLEADAHGDGATPSPLVFVFDDLHHAHDESLDLIAYLIDNLAVPVLILNLGRPEFLARRDHWLRHGGNRHRLVEVPPLSEVEAAAVMHGLLAPCRADGEQSDDDVTELVDAACTLAGGNPALLEQMVRIYLDAGVLEVQKPREDDIATEERWVVHPERLSSVRLPITVEDAVQARIAALAPGEREVLERAAVMGGVFWLGGLLAIQRLDEGPPDVWKAGAEEDVVRVRTILRELTDRDYVLRLPDSSFLGDEEYVFKHNLEREALLRLTAPGTARIYHRTVADWIAFKDNVASSEEYLGMLARHREKAGAKVLAAHAYLQAADVARSHYASTTAVEHYVKGLALLGDGADRDADQRLRALHHYGDVLQLLGRNEEALSTFREMLGLAYRLDVRAKGGAAHSRIGRLHRDRGQLAEATAHLDAALALFEVAADTRGIASTLDDLGKLQWLKGDYKRALGFTQRALTMRQQLGDRRSIALSLNNLGLVFQDSGQFKEALGAFEHALAIRREIGDLVGVSISLNNLGTVAQDQRDDPKALSLFQEALDLAKETGDRNRTAVILTNLGETYARLGHTASAIHYLRQAEELADELGDKLGLAEAVRGLGKAYLAQKDLPKARECTARAVALFQEVKSRVQLGVALRSLGEVTAAGVTGGKEAHTAREHLLESIRIFEAVGNDVELARSFRAYVALVKGVPELQASGPIAAEALTFAKRADDIFTRLKEGSRPPPAK